MHKSCYRLGVAQDVNKSTFMRVWSLLAENQSLTRFDTSIRSSSWAWCVFSLRLSPRVGCISVIRLWTNQGACEGMSWWVDEIIWRIAFVQGGQKSEQRRSFCKLNGLFCGGIIFGETAVINPVSSWCKKRMFWLLGTPSASVMDAFLRPDRPSSRKAINIPFCLKSGIFTRWPLFNFTRFFLFYTY